MSNDKVTGNKYSSDNKQNNDQLKPDSKENADNKTAWSKNLPYLPFLVLLIAEKYSHIAPKVFY